MSTGADCVFEEREPGRWWYRIQAYPYGECSEYTEHGPFASEEMAIAHLDRHYANPGGWSTVSHGEWQERIAARAARKAEREAREAARRR